VIDNATLSHRGAHPRRELEPCIGQVYFAPEAHPEYVRLGFSESRGSVDGVALPDPVAYFTSRGSLMGQVAPHVIAATFAVFNPEVVVPCVQIGWGPHRRSDDLRRPPPRRRRPAHSRARRPAEGTRAARST